MFVMPYLVLTSFEAKKCVIKKNETKSKQLKLKVKHFQILSPCI